MLTRDFVGPVNVALVLGAGALLVGAGVSSVRAHHEARRAREAVCAARVEAVVARNPYVRRYVLPVDPCVALEVVTR